ncbi:FAD-dependent monooxygenase [Psychromonas sp. KJ10-10]|uniref:FAD-dependent monooxygenase n=1 Tax=Psychromonas sp. KJ10-10 TaxID=3391823 RepID=UPI0039B6E88C
MINRQIIVIGGGMVGALTALLLAKQGFVIHLIEKAPDIPDLDSPFDLRVSAFSAQSKLLLEQAGVWDKLPQTRLRAYHGLQTWERGSHKLSFDSKELDLQALGYIAENRLVQAVLWQSLKDLDNVVLHEKRTLLSIKQDLEKVTVTLDNQQVIDAELLIGCDGANSVTRRLLDIGVTAWQYRQHCMLINIKTDKQQHKVNTSNQINDDRGITWQEFRETGPCAFLPLAGDNASLVWYHSPEKIKQLLSLNNTQLKKQTIVRVS